MHTKTNYGEDLFGIFCACFESVYALLCLICKFAKIIFTKSLQYFHAFDKMKRKRHYCTDHNELLFWGKTIRLGKKMDINKVKFYITVK